MSFWTTLVFDAVAGLFLLWAFFAVWHFRWAQRLPAWPSTDAGPADRGTPVFRCSVVIAARDERARIEQTLRRLLAQREVDLEIIVVDDRSTDGTTELLQQLAKDDTRILVKRVDVLPEGWLGKCHACHLGASAATRDWILFTDGDCWIKPDVIARALRAAEREQADHITLVSGVASGGFGLRASHLMFLVSLSNWISGVNRDRPKAFLGIGAFNLVRAEAYRQCGGYEALRLTVVDDVKLGLLMRRAGKRTRAYLGGDDVEAQWGISARSMIKIMEKNYFAALDYRTSLVVGGSVFFVAVTTIIILGLLSGAPAGWAAAFAPLSLIAPAGVVNRRLGWPWGNALLAPLMLPLFLYALLNSTFVTLGQGGIRWRDTFYPLAKLRTGNVR